MPTGQAKFWIQPRGCRIELAPLSNDVNDCCEQRSRRRRRNLSAVATLGVCGPMFTFSSFVLVHLYWFICFGSFVLVHFVLVDLFLARLFWFICVGSFDVVRLIEL